MFFLSTASLAQEKPEAPKPKTDRKVFFAGVSLLAASATADAITTRKVLDIPGGRGSELNPLFGPHPSPAKQAGINLGIFAAQSAAFYFTERSRHKWIRWTGRAFLAHEIEEHSRFAACNVGLNTNSLVTYNCAGHAILKTGRAAFRSSDTPPNQIAGLLDRS